MPENYSVPLTQLVHVFNLEVTYFYFCGCH